RKVATVLFADLVGSTALASGDDPERVRFRLEQFYEAMADEVHGAGGTVEKFAGDAVMAVFGAPAALEDHAERALHAALAMQRPRGVSGLHPAFVGREPELAQLQAAYRQVIGRRRPMLVTIVGDAGLGKTRLVRELWQWLAVEEPQPLQRTGRCLPYGQITFW